MTALSLVFWKIIKINIKKHILFKKRGVDGITCLI